jgi:lipid II:glycine glycyltransferase (peptidoglycan interpeptide bridge formation enzyme)
MPAYLLQWEMMLEGKRRGCIIYDFLGIAPDGIKRHPLAGVTDFKLKFGGEIRQWPEARILVVRPMAYAVLKAARLFRKVFR